MYRHTVYSVSALVLSALFLGVLLFSSTVLAHSSSLGPGSASIELSAGTHTIFIDHAPAELFTGAPITFQFELESTETATRIFPHSIYYTVSSDTGVTHSGQLVGGTLADPKELVMSFVEPGFHTLSLSFLNQDGTVLASAESEINVEVQPFSSDSSADSLFAVALGVVLGVLLVYMVQMFMRRKA